MTKKISVVGAGSWGTALAKLLAHKGFAVTLWVYEADLAQRMQATQCNDLYLPGITLPKNLVVTADLAAAVQDRDVVVLVPPSQVMRRVALQAAPHIAAGTLIVSAAKGIENDTLLPMSDLLLEVLPPALHERLTFLSGPSFAREVACGMPTAVVAAAHHHEAARAAQQIFSNEVFRVYTTDDVIGVELGGAVKNVIALAAGVVDGLGFGYNTRAALITRGLAEMTRLGLAMGARSETFAGLAGMGDLVLTCTGDLSRNRSVGIELGKGRKIAEILDGMHAVAEGVRTTLSTWQLANRLHVPMPITEQVYQILYEDKDPGRAVTELMLRELKDERH
ncbi:MAG: NAD(P)-dependent glycerol-3-phosphate dehydrogenase [Desulfuromonadales bacterium]|nr:NAD(P)-dependent glycerol-3-phosphate dehydrogenase [Desulfuromonadales bacterium]